MTTAERSRVSLCEAIVAVGIPFDGASGLPPSLRLDFHEPVTPEQRAIGMAIADAWDWSDSAQADRETSERGFDPNAVLSALRAGTATSSQVQRVLAFLLAR